MKYILGGFTIFVLIYIFVYILRAKIRKSPETTGTKTCELFYFYTSWCPYCKKTRVEWDKFKSEWGHKTYNGYVLQFQEVDCDANESTATKYNVTKYPTIKLVKEDTVFDFDAKPTVDSLTRFLNASFES
jgi:thiol-disulfide isomerase/thioredoxin